MDLAGTDLLILCGGLGTRLAPLLADRPKALADVGGRAFLDLLLDEAERQGVRRFILCVGHGARAIRAHLRGSPREVIFSEEPRPLGTAGALKLAEPLTRGGACLVMNGDSFCPVDLGALLARHERSAAAATIAVVAADERRDGGFVRLDESGRLTAFSEKGRSGTAPLVNAGVYALGPAVLRAIPAGRPCSLETEVFPALLAHGLWGFLVPGPLQDIGTPERLEAFRRARRGL